MASSRTPRRWSRRTAIKAGVAVGGTAIISGVSYTALAKTPGKNGTVQGPLVVHVTDLESGKLQIFTAGKSVEVKDKDLAKALVQAAADH